MGHSCSASWSSKLPRKLIRNISNRLTTRDQLVRFKRVCRRWRKHSFTLPVNNLSFTLPLTIPVSKSCKTLPFHSSTRSLVLQVSSIYLITPSHPSQDCHGSLKPWMVMVEESKPGKLRLRHSLTAKRLNRFPPTLDMSRFRALELARGYSFKNNDRVRKVILCSSTSTCLEVVVLCHDGNVGKLTVRVSESQAQHKKKKSADSDTEEEEDIDEERVSWKCLKRERSISWFRYLDDIVEFKKKYLIVDRKGKLYELDIESMKVVRILVSDSVHGEDCVWHSQRQKRLVVDPTSRGLYLVARERSKATRVSFTIYKYNENSNRWDIAEHLGKNRVLFVGVHHCFFAQAKDFPKCKGNCIVFAANCFPHYRSNNAPDKALFGDNDDVEVGVYRLGKGDNFKFLSANNPKLSKSIWPPPTWFSSKRKRKAEETDSDSCTHQDIDEGSSGCSFSDDHEEGMQLDSSSSKPSKASSSKGITDSDEDSEEVQMSSPNEQTCDSENHDFAPPLPIQYEVHDVGTSKMDHQKTGKDSGPDASNVKVETANPIPLTPSTKLPACSTVTFEGLDINSELLPTLQTLWGKHGSLISEGTVHDKHIRAYALELVAKLVITLQNTPAKNLTDAIADGIKLTLSDLQKVGLKVDWLVPAVENTLTVQKQKPLIESIQRLNKRKAQVDEEEKQFLARATKVKQEIEKEYMACLSAGIPPSKLINPDDCLAGGLL